MTTLRGTLALASLLQFCVAGALYGNVRSSEFGPDPIIVGFALAVAAVIGTPTWLLSGAACDYLSGFCRLSVDSEARGPRIWVIILWFGVAGCVAAEISMSWDEWVFAQEAPSRIGTEDWYSRPRRFWPGGIEYTKGSGCRAFGD